MSDVILSIKNLNLRNKLTDQSIIIVNNFDINKGDLIFINGKNGTGKSTFLDYVFRINNTPKYVVSKDAFSIDYHSQNSTLTNEKLFNSKIVYLSQKNTFPSKLSLYKTLFYSTKIAIQNSDLNTVEKNELLKKAKQLARHYMLDGLESEKNLFFELINDYRYQMISEPSNKLSYAIKKLDRIYSSQLSGGQTKLVAFLSALIKVQVFESDIFVMDEPLNNLDFSKMLSVINLTQEVIDQRASNPITLLIISHLMIFPIIHLENAIQYTINPSTRELLRSEKNIDHTQILKDFY
ncbi:ATP-binding cassette domain-containing protein [Liberiplasma polymorphum]|uniref:ATP-binding cassette domain-containing protein n=1 Tax=Liberiplasma polymorphum TaxID=3374570 RepID=UPI003773577B